MKKLNPRIMKLSYTLPLLLLFGLLMFVSCSDDSEEAGGDDQDQGGGGDQQSDEFIIWDGDLITFTKAADADPALEDNQDRISDGVWITRANTGGQIYNAKVEDEADQDSSPAATEWAIGTIDDIESLNFTSFRDAVGSPKDVVGKDLVLKLVDENILITVKFLSWGSGRAGSFSYERSTASN